MGDLSEHFSSSEFACKCGCGFSAVSSELVSCLEELRMLASEQLGHDAPLIIRSGCRCQNYNDAVGGAPRSQHVHGRAADIFIAGLDPAQAARLAETVGPILGTPGRVEKIGGIGVGSTRVHVDVRPRKMDGSRSRWTYGDVRFDWRSS